MVEVSGKRRLASEAVANIELAKVEAHAPLLEAIAENVDDPAPWTVYADLLQTLDHPRGELITLMLEREAYPSSRLFELQRRLFTAAAKVLQPIDVPSEVIVGWRRGFPSELRVTAPDQLAAIKGDATLRLVTTATLVMSGSFEEWSGALDAVRLPWRHLRVELDAECELVVRPILAAVPAVETLRITFPDAGVLDWTDARAEHLRAITAVNCSVDGIERAALPRLAELRLHGNAEPVEQLRGGAFWNRLSRIVLPAPDGEDSEDSEDTEESDDDGPTVTTLGPLAGPPAARDDDDYYNDEPHEPSTAFFVVDQLVTRALLRKLAGNTSISSLSARVCSVRSMPRATVIQLFGPAEAELMPYSFALALESVMQPTPRIALVEVDGDQSARHLVLGTKPIRATEPTPAETVRRALDLAIGYDPGAGILTEVLDELGATPIERLVGEGRVEQLSMIDPSSAPLVMEPEPDVDDEDGDDDDYGYDYDYDEDLFQADCYEEPIVYDDEDDLAEEPAQPVVLPTTRPATPPAAAPEPSFLLDLDLGDELEVHATGQDTIAHEIESALLDDGRPPPDDDALVLPPYDRFELWFDYAEHWEDRALAVDDEEFETRWPDPAQVERAHDDVELRAEPACAHHQTVLESCKWCDAPLCAECDGEDWCSTCFAQVIGLVQPEWVRQMTRKSHQDDELAQQQLAEMPIGVALREAAGREQLASAQRPVDASE